MKIAIKVLTLFLLFSCQRTEKKDCNYITDYFPHSTNAEMEFYLGNYEESFEHFQKAFSNCEPIALGMHNDIGLFAKVCTELGKEDLALDYIEKRIAVGGTIGEFQNDRIFNNLLNSERGKKIVAGYDQKRAKFIGNLSTELRSEIQNMIRLDQELNSTSRQDSMFRVNDKRLVQIIEKYGYPNEQIIGSYNIDQINSDPRILLLHSDDSIRLNYFIPKIKKFVENGKCAPYTLGTVLDNLELFNGQPQTHGTYLQDGGGYANMISDKQKVNVNRKNIGLPTMEITKKLDSLRMMYWESR